MTYELSLGALFIAISCEYINSKCKFPINIFSNINRHAIVKESSNKHEAAHVENENKNPNDGVFSHHYSDVCASRDTSMLDHYKMNDLHCS